MTDYGSFRWCFMCDTAVALGLDPAEHIVGYDPQKLLPSPERLMREYVAAVVGMFPLDANSLFISSRDWAVLTRKLTPDFKRLYEDTPPKRDWYWPDFPNDGEISLARPREHTFEHKIAIVKAPWDEIELRALAHDRRIRGIVLDMEGGDDVIPGPSFDAMLADARRRSERDTNLALQFRNKPTVSTAAGKRDMSYLKHDRTKQHRRRRR